MKSGVFKKLISLKLVAGGPNKICGVGKKLSGEGDVYSAPESSCVPECLLQK